jgi:hypothetical protein
MKTHCTLYTVHLCHISLNSSHDTKCFKQRLQRKSEHAFYIQNILPGNCAFYEIMWNVCQAGQAT